MLEWFMDNLENIDDFNEIFEKSSLYALYKHSSICPVSATGHSQMEILEKLLPDLKIYKVLVIENRPISNKISEKLGVEHKSPQFLLVKDRKLLWNVSHFEIKTSFIKDYLVKNKLITTS